MEARAETKVSRHGEEILEQIWSIGFNGKLKDAVAVSRSGKFLYLPRGNTVIVYPLPLATFGDGGPHPDSDQGDAQHGAHQQQRRSQESKLVAVSGSGNSTRRSSQTSVGGRGSRAQHGNMPKSGGRINDASEFEPPSEGELYGCEGPRKLYLKCHRNQIHSMAVSKNERFLASGELHPSNGRAETVLWELGSKNGSRGAADDNVTGSGSPPEAARILGRHNLHWTCVTALAFSPNEMYLASLGGAADGSLNVFDIRSRRPITGCKAVGHHTRSTGNATCVSFHPSVDNVILVGGTGSFFAVWTMSPHHHRLACQEIELGTLVRSITTILPVTEVNCEAICVYAGTESGDILKFKIYDESRDSGASDADSTNPKNEPKRTGASPSSGSANQNGVGDALFLGCLAPKRGSKAQPARDPFKKGIVTMHEMPCQSGFLVGCGDGTLVHVEDRSSYEDDQNAEVRAMKARRLRTKLPPAPSRLEALVMKVTSSVLLHGAVTGIAVHCSLRSGKKWTAVVTTAKQCFYRVDLDSFKEELILSSHDGSINALAIPRRCVDANFFATCGGNEVRLWGFVANRPLKIFTSPNSPLAVCFSLAYFPSIGSPKFIFSGWSDGAIRGWSLEQSSDISAEPAIDCLECHPGHTVSSLGIVCGGNYLLSGGSDGSVKLWEMYMSCGRRRLRLDKASRQQKAAVHSIVIEENRDLATWDLRFASASQDRTCVVWSLRDLRPLHVFKANCIFNDICFHPKEPELVTVGTDARVHYWDAFSGSHIRTLITPIFEHDEPGGAGGPCPIPGGGEPWDGKPKIGLSSLDMETFSGEGKYFVTGGQSRVIQVWDYLTGRRLGVTQELTSPLRHVRMHSCGNLLVAVTEDQTILCWRLHL